MHGTTVERNSAERGSLVTWLTCGFLKLAQETPCTACMGMAEIKKEPCGQCYSFHMCIDLLYIMTLCFESLFVIRKNYLCLFFFFFRGTVLIIYICTYHDLLVLAHRKIFMKSPFISRRPCPPSVLQLHVICYGQTALTSTRIVPTHYIFCIKVHGERKLPVLQSKGELMPVTHSLRKHPMGSEQHVFSQKIRFFHIECLKQWLKLPIRSIMQCKNGH